MNTPQQNLETLITKQLPYLKNVALSFTKSEAAAEDLLQDTIVRIWSYQEKFTMGTNFKAWSSVIMRNIFINGYRKQKVRRAQLEAFRYQQELDGEQTALNSGELELNYKETLRQVELMKTNYSTPIQLYHQGFSYQEIADELHTSLGTVKSRIHTARCFLREKLEVA